MNIHKMDAFEFVLPTKVVFGVGSVKKTAEELKVFGGKHPLIVTDRGGCADACDRRIYGGQCGANRGCRSPLCN